MKVVRADRGVVEFGYDALGRRVWKKYRGRVTRWVWDGNTPLHEWVEGETPTRVRNVAPPRKEEGTQEAPITWLFEPESFAPMGKLVGEAVYAVVTDHLGTPIAMCDAKCAQSWAAELGIWGQVRTLQGEREACPFRWPGQYEDVETGLYYNRFRYYDPKAGQYISQDPARLLGGDGLYTYVADPLWEFDPLGLASCSGNRGERTARTYFRLKGYAILGSVKNKSGHGIDLVARSPKGKLTFFEVKWSAGARTGSLSSRQKIGSMRYAEIRLDRAFNAQKHWSHAQDPLTKVQARALLKEMRANGSEGFLVRIAEGASPGSRIAVTPW